MIYVTTRYQILPTFYKLRRNNHKVVYAFTLYVYTDYYCPSTGMIVSSGGNHFDCALQQLAAQSEP